MQADLMEDEEFCLQVDSHTDVVKNWDVKVRLIIFSFFDSDVLNVFDV